MTAEVSSTAVPNTSNPPTNQSSSVAVKVGIGVAAVLAVVLLVGFCVLVLRRRERRPPNERKVGIGEEVDRLDGCQGREKSEHSDVYELPSS